ncbi:hypothetical protein Q8A67_017670 [Cirrhinus molitorella]|uniref:Adhesion G protein-coupled receptor F5 n=1 Tax=Cirrhinus molitorella TaxID=172907 RepID=A0AA88THA3_9TELE|nr:hypothetical protein Q8A67_017670 [Cirrhinus molitorella]
MGSYNCACLDGFTATISGLPISIDNKCTATTPIPPTTNTTAVKMSMKIDKDFDITLEDSTSQKFREYAEQIELAIEKSYEDMTSYVKNSVKVFRFRPGSILADYQIDSTSSSLSSAELAKANTEVAGTLTAQGFPVDIKGFAQSEQANLSTVDKWYPLNSVTLKCKLTNAVGGTMRWTVNDQDPTLDKAKYVISSDRTTLIVNNVNERDKGRYACILDGEIRYIQWQDIVIEPLPKIVVGENKRFQCTEQTVELTCCESNYEVEWTPTTTADEVTPPDKGCITLKHKIVSADCAKRVYICQLKILELRDFSYGQRTVTVEEVKDEFTCKSTTLGDGKEDDILRGPCEKGMDGIITYQCILKQWREISRNCILQVIKDIVDKVEALVPLEIPNVVAELSTAAKNNTEEIIQSSVTVQTIVGILVKVADVSQKIIISQPVMVNFLKTVDILVSTLAIDTWNNINSNGTTDNTSTALLSAIEIISSRLTDTNFRINETSLELNRTVTNSTFYSGISSLPNSSTEIQIPEVPINTAITIIVFTTLGDILPTRNTTTNTSNTGNNTSDVRINGDVVVVKVDNKTINNISFAFDLTDQSLGNAQCVFWNFNLDAWDSFGCKAKTYISNGNETGRKMTCECNHTTSFSILMSPFVIGHDALAYITYIGVAISLASLIICLIIEAIVWKAMTRNDTSYMRHVSIINIAVSLLIANVCFIIGAAVADSEQPTSVGRCSPVVFFMHFFYLAVFFWMLISALLLFYRTVMVFSQMSRVKMMIIAFIVGYVAPLLIASITVASTAGPQHYVSQQACWLNWFESYALLAFVIPALSIVAINLVVLIVVLYKMLRRGVGAATQPDEKHALVVIARCVAILTPIFGLTWGFGIGTMVSRDLGIHIVFALLNSLQGFFILVFGTLLDSKIREALAGTLSLRNLTSSNRTRSTSAGPSSSSGLGFFQRMRRRNVYNISEASALSGATSSNSSNGSDTYVNA